MPKGTLWAVVALILLVGIASQHGSNFSNAPYYPLYQPHYRPIFAPMQPLPYMRPPVYRRPQLQPQPPEYPFEPAPEPPSALPEMSDKDSACLAVNVYRESRGEPQYVQAMVAYVTLNRTRYGDYFGGPSVCGVVYKEHQFSWTDTSLRSAWPRNRESLKTAYGISQWVYQHGLPVSGYKEALFFANVSEMSMSARCRFMGNLVPLGTLGRLTFFRWRHRGESPRGCDGSRYAQN